MYINSKVIAEKMKKKDQHRINSLSRLSTVDVKYCLHMLMLLDNHIQPAGDSSSTGLSVKELLHQFLLALTKARFFKPRPTEDANTRATKVKKYFHDAVEVWLMLFANYFAELHLTRYHRFAIVIWLFIYLYCCLLAFMLLHRIILFLLLFLI